MMKINCSLKSMLWNLYKDDKITYGEWQILQKKLEGHDRELIKSIEAEPVRHGKWIKMSDADGHYYACSECGEELTRIQSFGSQFDLFPRLKSINKTKYCPNCGTTMDEVNHETN